MRLRHVKLRTTSLLLAAALTATACSGVADVVDDITTQAGEAVGEVVDELVSDSPGSGGDGDTGEAPAPGDAPADGETGGSDGGGDTPSAGGNEAPAGGLSAPLDDFASVGFHGPAMLRGSVSKLVVEVDVQSGVRVSQAAMDHLVGRMRAYVDKPGGVVVSGGNTFSSDRTQWSSAQLREIASQNRDTRSGGDTVSVYVLYVEGEFIANGQSTNAIGVAHNASEFAVFPDKWAGLGGLLGSDSAIERAVLVHEWGHLLGLVNIGYTSEIDHEDPEHKGHSRNQGSAMYWAIESTLISQVFSGPPPDDFDDADRADLEGLRTGKYRG